MSLRLEEISSQVAPSAVAAVVCDGAGWHAKGREPKVPDNIVLVTLPPYSPELNPMEIVWQYLRGNKPSAGTWDSYDEILVACANAWHWVGQRSGPHPLHRHPRLSSGQSLGLLV